ncbi:hypothetical protein BDZ94DRAFT_1327707 [Collybia nuda]|uniref:Uncharacterized protein n=1 Tax=Collybia nuda TaxID=64659 RepID=A0A9P6C7T6_9AGAR|nr:hypothetical protein BDZ94DRAFT_1327707 [Collybia nuda]
MSRCAFPGGPPLNNDIAGIGVRISIYIQSILTTIFVTVSTSPEDIYTQIFTCMVMHISIVSAALVLGTTSNPQITLQDGVIATLMLLFPRSVTRVSGASLLCLAKGSIVDPWKNIPVNVLHEIMDILSTLFSFQLLVNHGTFGSHPECNSQAKIFIFKTFTASHTWFIFSFVLHVACLVFEIAWIVITFFTTLWYSRKKRMNPNAEAVDTEVVITSFLLNFYLKGKEPEKERNEIVLTEFVRRIHFYNLRSFRHASIAEEVE